MAVSVASTFLTNEKSELSSSVLHASKSDKAVPRSRLASSDSSDPKERTRNPLISSAITRAWSSRFGLARPTL